MNALRFILLRASFGLRVYIHPLEAAYLILTWVSYSRVHNIHTTSDPAITDNDTTLRHTVYLLLGESFIDIRKHNLYTIK